MVARNVTTQNTQSESRLSRWTSLTAGIFCVMCAGTVYAFGALRAPLKSALSAEETDMGVIGLMGNIGLWAGAAVGGMVLDHYGPRPGIFIGGFLQFVGYILLSFALGGPQSHSEHMAAWASPLLFAFIWLLCGFGCGFLYNTTMFANARNFPPQSRGVVIGLLATFFGLSPTVCVIFLEGCIGGSYHNQICDSGFPNNHLPSYALSIALFVLSCSALGALFTRQRTPEDVANTEEQSFVANRLFALLAVAFCLVIWSSTLSLLQATPSVASNAAVGTWAPLTLIFFALALMILRWRVQKHRIDGSLLSSFARQVNAAKQPPPSISLLDALRMVQFWLLFVVMACIIGSNVSTMNITSTIVKDRHIGTNSVAAMVQVITNSTSALVRCLGGLILYFAPGLPKLAPLAFSGLIAVVGQVLFASGVDNLVYIAAVLVGISDGMIWTCLPWLVGVRFGMRHSGSIFGCLVLLAASGVLLMGSVVEPLVYNSHLPARDSECYGAQCFVVFHMAAAAVSFIGTLAVAVLQRVDARKAQTNITTHVAQHPTSATSSNER